MIKSRTTADAVWEDPNLSRAITYEEYLNDDVGLEPDNQGGLIEMLKRAAKIEAELGVVDPYATDDSE